MEPEVTADVRERSPVPGPDRVRSPVPGPDRVRSAAPGPNRVPSPVAASRSAVSVPVVPLRWSPFPAVGPVPVRAA